MTGRKTIVDLHGVREAISKHGALTRDDLARKLRTRKPDPLNAILREAVRDEELQAHQIDGETYYTRLISPIMGPVTKLYQTVYADPPWQYRDTTCRGASKKHYSVMTVDEVASLPVMQRAAPNAHLWLWITKDMFLDGAHLKVIPAWGFRHITFITWVKAKEFERKITCPECKTKLVVKDPKGKTVQMGLGRYFRGTKEVLIFAVRGRAPIPPEDRMLDLFFHPKTLEHSRKPYDVYDKIESVSKGPYLEMFSEVHRHGWDAWGQERKGEGHGK
jgi:N6-adenosine-specific RNA methylase IME4